MDLALVNDKRVDFHAFDRAGSTGADAMIIDPAAAAYIQRSWDEARRIRECEQARRQKIACVECCYLGSSG